MNAQIKNITNQLYKDTSSFDEVYDRLEAEFKTLKTVKEKKENIRLREKLLGLN
jgi:hypothetical protein